MPINIFGDQAVISALFRANAVGIKRPKAIRFRRGTLSPGAYIDNRKLPSHPDEWETIIGLMRHQAIMLRKEFDIIASVATGGISHGSVLAWLTARPHVIVKKQEKVDAGLGGLIDGDVSILSGARVLLIEDMSSTFKSSLKAMEVLEHEGAQVTHTMLINTWNLPDFQKNIENHSVFALCTGETLVDLAVRGGKIDAEHEQIVRHWLVHPEDESWFHDGKWELPK